MTRRVAAVVLALVPAEVATRMLVVPEVWAGETADICVSLSTVKLAAEVEPK